MGEKADTILETTKREAGNAVPVAQEAAPAVKHFQHTEIKGRFNQYTSGFWGLAIPMLSARYSGRWFSKLFRWEESKNPIVRRLYGIYVATVMLGVTSFYASRTWADMKRVFSETLGYEFDKKPEEIGIRDFFKSENAIVHRTLWNFLKYNSRRGLFANTTFFNFLIPGVLEKHNNSSKGLNIYDSVDLGVGGTGAYLATDVIWRKETFFEKLQAFIDHKINHTDSMGDLITAGDLISLYDRHARDDNPNHPISERMDTPAWKNDQILFNRMAELMNQTYGSTPVKEHANFTIPKFIYLLGQKTVKADSLEENLAYVEIANRYGIPAVKQLVAAIKSGTKLEEVLKKFPVPLPDNIQENADNQQDTGKFAGKLGENRSTARPGPAPSSSYTEKTLKNDSPAVGATL